MGQSYEWNSLHLNKSMYTEMGLGNQSQHKLISCHDTNHWKIELIEIEFYRIMSMRIDDYVRLTNEVLSFAKHIQRCPLIVPFGTISLLVPWIWVCYLTWSIQGQHYSDIRRDVVSNHQRLDCLLSNLLRCRSKKNIKVPRYWPLWGEFTGVSISWRHHELQSHVNVFIALWITWFD